MIRPILLAGLLALGACGSTLPPAPQSFSQGVVQAGLAYNAAATAAVAYARQPRCGTEGAKPPPLCADRDRVIRLGQASEAARAALRIAEQLATMPAALPAAQDAALATAVTRITDLQAIEAQTKGAN